MKVSAARFIPVLAAFPETEARQETWGRFLELQSNRARLITRARLEKGDVLILCAVIVKEKLNTIKIFK